MTALIRPELTGSSNLETWLQDFFRNGSPFRGFWSTSPGANGHRNEDGPHAYLAADFYEDKEAFHAMMELPGVRKEDVEVELENSVLRISGKHTDKFGGNEHTYEFSRSLAMPDGVDGSKISAEMKDGMLKITMPKMETKKARAIEIH